MGDKDVKFGTYTILPDWLMERKDLSTAEKLIFARILRFNKGCYESSAKIAKAFNLNQRTVRRALKRLMKKNGKQWIAALHPTDWTRILYATPENIPPGPLWDQVAARAIQFQIKETAQKLSAR